MSLIGEALKRARLEAARREGEERGTAHSSVPAYLPARRRSRAGIVGAILLAALLGAGVVYVFVRSSSTPERSAPPPLLGKEERTTAGDVGTAPVRAELAAPPAAQAAPAESPPAPIPSPLPPAPAMPAAAQPARPAAPSPPGARIFVSVAQLGGTRLELDGIVASPTDPVAMINRKLLGIGEGLDGWVVETIEAKQVTLRGGSQTIVLRLR